MPAEEPDPRPGAQAAGEVGSPQKPPVLCRDCENENPAGSRFCAVCGADLATPEQQRLDRARELGTGKVDHERLARFQEMRERLQSRPSIRGSPALYLLTRIENPALRALAVVVAVGVPLALVALDPPFSNLQILGLVLFGVLGSLLLPSSLGTGWRKESADETDE